MPVETDLIEAVIGHRFSDRALLVGALTHRSRAHDQKGPAGHVHNERLEFLGDAVLGLLVSQYLLDHFPAESEGRLSKIKAHLVSADHLHRVAMKLGLGEFLRLGRCEEMSGGRSKRALLADAVEAIIAAVYLDAGLDAARAFIVAHVLPAQASIAEATPGPERDYKGALQEMAQALKLPHPEYSTIQEKGPEHAKSFVIEVRIGAEWTGRGEGTSKKKASQIAAKMLLERLEKVMAPSLASAP
jgi:ribonuclease III